MIIIPSLSIVAGLVMLAIMEPYTVPVVALVLYLAFLPARAK